MKKLTQAKIARSIQVSEAFLSQLANGLRRPSWTTAKKLAEVTGTNPILWLEGTPEAIKQALSNSQEAA